MRDCPQAGFGGGLCKHASAAEASPSGRWAALHKKVETIIKRPKIKCHHGCKKSRIVRDGRRNTRRKGAVQKYPCRRCDKRFSGLRKLKGRHASIGVMADGLSRASKGMPLSKAAMETGRKGRHFHPSAIYRRAAKRGPLTDMHAKKFRPWAGFKRHCG